MRSPERMRTGHIRPVSPDKEGRAPRRNEFVVRELEHSCARANDGERIAVQYLCRTSPGDFPVQALARALAEQLGGECAPEPQRAVAGGSFDECYRWRCASGTLFVKVAAAPAAARFAAEAAGLAELARAAALRTPRVCARGIAGEQAFLALEWIDAGSGTRGCERRLGEGLAAVHRASAERFGWRIDNNIGATAQLNGWWPDWVAFWRERRLRPQLQWAFERGFGRLLEQPGARLLEALGDLLAGHQPRPSLLHGDLWGGNWFADSKGEPVIFDPAVYYGDREADLAMTRLFGGFGAAFYEAYEGTWPLPAGHAVRLELYNLYHVLNHANLFGAGYARQARSMIERLLAEVAG